MSDLPEYVIDRVFDAPKEMVWKAWTDPELLSRWYGPGVETIIHKFELKPGGVWLNEMNWGEKSMLNKIVFREVVTGERLVWHNTPTDSDWNAVSNPMMPDWPRVMQATVTFEEAGTTTKVRLTWTPFEPSEAELACFAGAVGNMGKGWESGFNIMAEMFAELQAASS